MTVYVIDDSNLDALAELLADKILERKTPQQTKWMTAEETAEYLGLSTKGIYNRASANKIPFHRIDGRMRFDRDELDRWVRG